MKNLKSKWVAVPIVTGVLVFGSIAIVAGANQNSDKETVNGTKKDNLLTNEEIVEKALTIVDGTVTEVELEKTLTRTIYEVEINKDGFEYDLDMDAVTGKVLKNDKSADDKDDKEVLDDNSSKTDSSKVAITREAAIETALIEATGTVTDIELERDDSQTFYKIEVEDGTKEVEVKVDANTGAVLSVDEEDDNDEDDDEDDI
jgi:uncharacterized membrane protein YkoI